MKNTALQSEGYPGLPEAQAFSTLPHPQPLLDSDFGPAANQRFDLRRFLLLAFLVCLGAAYRLDFLIADFFAVDSDEAIVGLMAKHMLEGKGIPIFYYGQHYMGSLEAICVAGLGALFGLSTVTLKLVPLIFSLLLIISSFAIADTLAGRRAGFVAGLLFTLPPFALLDWSTKARGGFIELVFLGSLIILVTMSACRRLERRSVFLLGLLIGTGWWVNNQVLYFIPASSIALSYAVLFHPEFRLKLRSFVVLVAIGAAGFFLGSSPFWLYNIQHQFASFGIFERASAHEAWSHLSGFTTLSLPILLGAKQFWHTDDIFPYATLLYGLTYASLFCVFACKPLPSGTTAKFAARADRLQLCCFLLTVPLVFSASSFGDLVQAPRYVLPLYLGIFVVTGVAVSALPPRSFLFSSLLVALLIGLNLVSACHGGRHLPGEPLLVGGDRVAKRHDELISALRERNIRWIRANYWIGYRLAFETNEEIRFLVHGQPHRVRIPEYESAYPVESERWKVPIVAGIHEAEHLRSGLTRLGYTFESERVGPYSIIFHIERRDPARPLRRIGISPGQIHASARDGDARFIVDGSTRTRWGSGSPQRKNMEVTIDFPEPRTIAALHYLIGDWDTDWPRVLDVRCTGTDGSEWNFGLAAQFSHIQYLLSGEPDLWVWLEPHAIRRMTIRQLGESAKFDWSIAELELFEPASLADENPRVAD